MKKTSLSNIHRRTIDPSDIEIIAGAGIEIIGDDPKQSEIEIEFRPSRLEATEISEKYGNLLGPGTKYNQSVGAHLRKVQSKGVRVALRNPRAPDGVTIAYLTLVGLPAFKMICNILNGWIKAKSGRRISIALGRFKLETTGMSPTDVAELIKLAVPLTQNAALLKPQNRKTKSSKTAKRKSVTALAKAKKEILK